MSPTIFVTNDDAPYSVELAGVGVIGGSGKGGIPVERAAQRIPELQDDNGDPLSGSQLTAAAKRFADARGLACRSVKEIDEEALTIAAGGFPRGPTIEEIASKAAARDAAFWEADQTARTAEDFPPSETTVLPQPIDKPKER
jgi:hypothetical protein